MQGKVLQHVARRDHVQNPVGLAAGAYAMWSDRLARLVAGTRRQSAVGHASHAFRHTKEHQGGRLPAHEQLLS